MRQEVGVVSVKDSRYLRRDSYRLLPSMSRKLGSNQLREENSSANKSTEETEAITRIRETVKMYSPNVLMAIKQIGGGGREK